MGDRHDPLSAAQRDASASTPAGLHLRGDITWKLIDGQIVLLDLSGSSYFSVSGAGVTLWPLIVAGTTFEALVELLAASFELARDAAEHDVRAFLDALADEGLLATGAAALKAEGTSD